MKLSFPIYLLPVLCAQVALAVPEEFLLRPRDQAANPESKNTTAIPIEAIPEESGCRGNCTVETLKFISDCTTANCNCDDGTNTKILGCLDCLVEKDLIPQDLNDALEAEYVNTCAARNVRIGNAKAGNGASPHVVGGWLAVAVAVALGTMGSVV